MWRIYFAVSDLASVPGAIWLFHAGELFQEVKKQFPGRQIPPIPSDYSDMFFDSNSPEVCFPFRLPTGVLHSFRAKAYRLPDRPFGDRNARRNSGHRGKWIMS